MSLVATSTHFFGLIRNEWYTEYVIC